MDDEKQVNIFRVMPENVTRLWDQIEALLTPALALASTHSADDVRRSLLSMQAQLWIQIEDSIVEALVTTEFVNYPKGLFLRVWSAGARADRKMDSDGFYDVLRAWAETNGCIGFEAIGRHGWSRKVKKARIEGLVMRELF